MIATVAPWTASGPLPKERQAIAGHPDVFVQQWAPDRTITWRKFGHTWLRLLGGTDRDQLALIENITLHTAAQ
jgi:hypothetical protein